ncbi:hypothetical protein [Maribellus maritimus]|uniref:hypothetical protein n=1 Tax=Maribellus maritimus TaxID=2870838 RepID=UPI001EECBCF3|nr:hypothetical protein [Maribellus maritimus]MCG6189710.1 hypothetical protein [Maribellus maritimus]
MISKKVKIRLLIVLLSGLFILGSLIFYAYAQTWGKTELEFRIHINEELVLQSVYGESPTFVIWIENPETRETKTIFVTNRAGVDDWEGKVDVPTALPKWDSIRKKEIQTEPTDINIDAVSGATPKPGYFITRVRVNPESKWICWIEMNLAGDYNENFPNFDKISKKTDEFGTGQPAIVYKTNIEAVSGNIVIPEVIGMSVLNEQGEVIQPLEGITSALNVFDEITISAIKPKPKIL